MKISRRNKRSIHSRQGFTLTELLIVMAILVLLVSMVGPRLLGSKKKADVNSTKTQIGMFQSALERYAIDMNTFPSTEDGLRALSDDPSGTGEGDDAEGSSSWDGPYLKTNVPKDPWGTAYSYEYPPANGKGDTPDIWSFGPDGQEGTDDDIVSWTGSGSGDEGAAESSGSLAN